MKKRAITAISVIVITLSAIIGLATGASVAAAGTSEQKSDGFTDVACVTADDCYAVGYYGDFSLKSFDGTDNILIEHWNGSTWSLSVKGLPIKGYFQYLSGISCPTATSCVAVGTIQAYGTNAEKNFIKTWNGKRWSRSAVPALPNGEAANLQNISCATAVKCELEGSYTTKSEAFGTVLEGWTAGKFKPQKTPVTPTGAQNELRSISCVPNGRCVAVGHGSTSKGVGYSTVNTFDGSTWKFAYRYYPPYGLDLSGVSCVSVTYCQLVGNNLEVRWNGSRVFKEASPKTKQWENLGSVSCVSDVFCRAVGTVVGPESNSPVAEGFNGRTWSLEKPVVPWVEGTTSLSNVACAGTVCQAVGSYSPSTNGLPARPLAERWQVDGWTVEKVRAP